MVLDTKQPLICDIIKYGVKEDISTKSVADGKEQSQNEKQVQGF